MKQLMLGKSCTKRFGIVLLSSTLIVDDIKTLNYLCFKRRRTLGLFTSNLPISAYRRRIRHQSQAGEISALSNNQQIQPEALGLSDGQLLPATTTGNSSSNSLLEPAGQDSLLTIPDPVNRPWYMQGGSKLPPPHKSDLPVRQSTYNK